MDRIVQLGDVFEGRFSRLEYHVLEVTSRSATLGRDGYTWVRPLTPSGTIDEEDLYRFVRAAPAVEGPAVGDLMPGDRVRLRYNNKGGTVVREWEGVYLIQWDHRSDPLPEHREDLVVLHAPRDTDAPLPAQKAIDEIDALRQQLIAEVEERQLKLRKLNSVKNKLKGIELH